jgi:CubicO group peptidase (beta-lactamase class C family)/pimeloyl-ACP methyl ester carboxylesterase
MRFVWHIFMKNIPNKPVGTPTSPASGQAGQPGKSHTSRVLQWLKRIGWGLVIGIVVIGLIGTAYQAIAASIDRRRYPAPGQMVDVGGYRLHLYCTGANTNDSPTVILESGLGAFSSAWAWVQPEVARAARVCAYDRAGMGWSDPSPEPRDAQHITEELHTLLRSADIPGPYVFAGWSIGGLYAREYARRYRDEVAGLVLLDSSSTDQCNSTPAGQAQCATNSRLYSIAPVLARLGIMRVISLFQPPSGLPAPQSGAMLASFSATKDWDAQSAEFLASPITNTQADSHEEYGSIPLFVLTATDHGTPSDLEQLWQGWQTGFTALSTDSVQRILPDATHTSILFDPADAKNSAGAILQVVAAARTGQPLASTPAAAIPLPVTGRDFTAVDAYVVSQMEDARIPGLALAIVDGDQIVYMKGFGIADPSGRPMTPQTPVMLASLAKPMTGLAIMQLVEAGKIDLDAPVQHYLPWFRVADEAASAQITVRHLLYHTSGLPESAGSEYGLRGDNRPDALEQQVRALRTVTLADPVGEVFHYSNPNYRVLGLLIQQITGQSYEAYMQEHVFGPLDMVRTFISLEDAQAQGLAKGYRFLFGQPLPFDEPFDRAGLASGSLIASAEDVAHFLIVNLNEGRYGELQIVSPPGLTEMHRPVTPSGKEHMAWDWGVLSVAGTQVLVKGGDLASYKTNMALFPEDRLGFVILINSNDRWATYLGDLSGSGIAIGLTSLMLGQEPPNLAGNNPLFFRLIVILIAIVQVMDVIWFTRAIRRWNRNPESSPRGPWELARYIGLPLILNLVWALVLLVGVPSIMGGYALSFLQYATPDLGYFLVVSGSFALVWGFLRTILAAIALRRAKQSALVPAM